MDWPVAFVAPLTVGRVRRPVRQGTARRERHRTARRIIGNRPRHSRIAGILHPEHHRGTRHRLIERRRGLHPHIHPGGAAAGDTDETDGPPDPDGLNTASTQ